MKSRIGRKLAGAALLLWGGVAPSWVVAAPGAAEVLQFQPRQQGIEITTPRPNETAACKVELVKGQGKASGWLLADANGQPLRRFFDSNGDVKIDVWSYFKDGVEVYREIDSNFNGKPDQYRWLNAGGSRHGVDANEDGKIDGWKAISPEEVSQELIAALASRDAARFQALLCSDADLRELPPREGDRVKEARKTAAAKFEAALAKATGLNSKTRYVHLEATQPQCLPADQTGGRADLIKYTNGTVLCETDGKNEWVQTGEIVQVAGAHRLVEGPTVGLTEQTPSPGNGIAVTDKELQGFLEQLRALDDRSPKGGQPGADPAVVTYNLQRTDLLEKIVAKVKPEERDPWVRQIADCLGAAAQASPATDKNAATRLTRLVEQVTKAMAGSALAAYVSYREMNADYAQRLAEKDANLGKIQEYWLERLAKFVQTYPKGEDTPDALMQLGMVSEFVGKEAEAKKWYQVLVRDFTDKPAGNKAAGCLRRLDLDGKAMQLSSPKLANPSEAFDLESLRGKNVIVYYWASWNGQCVGDFAKLKQILEAHKDAALVTVNLDTTVEEAKAFLTRSPVVGTHLYQPGGLDSPPATQYGVMGLPSVFLVGKDGKVVSHTVQVATLEEELKKLSK
jgi:thiol-disulfide isomerase/thioredoxin